LKSKPAIGLRKAFPRICSRAWKVIDQKKQTIFTGRDLSEIRKTVQKTEVKSDAWDKAVRRVERFALSTWSFGDLPESIVVEHIDGVDVLGYPGLVLRDGEVDLRLFKQRDEVVEHSPAAVRKLAENALGKDIAWLWKELRHLTPSGAEAVQSFHNSLSALSLSKPAAHKASAEQWQKDAHEHILRHMLRLQPLLPLTEKRFVALCESVRKDLPLITHRVGDLLKQTQEWKQKLQALPKPYPGLMNDLQRLLPPDILARTPHQQLQHLPRYLKAMQVRAERFSHSPTRMPKGRPDLRLRWLGEVVPSRSMRPFAG